MKISNETTKIADELKKDLVENYYANVYSQVLPLESLRVKLFVILTIFYTILFALAYYFLIFNSYIKVVLSEIFNIALIVWIIIILKLITLPATYLSGYYRKKLKEFYPQIFKIIGLKYYPATELHRISDKIRDSKLFPSANQMMSDDIFRGTHKGVRLSIAETKIVDSGYTYQNVTEKKTPETLYQGIITTMKSNKEILSTTLIKPKIDLLKFKKVSIFMVFGGCLTGLFLILAGICGAIESGDLLAYLPAVLSGCAFSVGFGYWFIESAILREMRHISDIQKVNLEDVIFSKYYQAYSYDQVEARYLITTAFIERFKYLSKVFHTKNIRCSFVDNSLVMAIASRKNNFELGGLCISLNNPKHTESFFEQIVAILLIVDYLKLNEKTKL